MANGQGHLDVALEMAFNTKYFLEKHNRYDRRKSYRLRKKREKLQKNIDYHCHCCDDKRNFLNSVKSFVLYEYYNWSYRHKDVSNYLKDTAPRPGTYENKFKHVSKRKITSYDQKYNLKVAQHPLKNYDEWLSSLSERLRKQMERQHSKILKARKTKKDMIIKKYCQREKYS